MKACIRILGVGLLLLLAACAASATSIQEAKQSPDLVPVTLSGKVVTYAGSGFFYIEEDNRCIGIRVEKANHQLTAGMRADITGAMATNNDTKERYILATTAIQTAPPNEAGSVAPVTVVAKSLGGGDWHVSGTGGQQGLSNGAGLNNVGLLLKVCGQFTVTGPTTFTINDGTAPAVPCQAADGTFLWSVWHSVVVTGVSSIRYADGEYKPLLLVRDIQVTTADEAVSTPGTPSGEASALTNLTYGYRTGGAICSHGHAVEYSFNWGDGTSTPWSTSKTATRSWTTTGTKTITVTARCQANPALQATSAVFSVNVVSSLPSIPWQMFRHNRSHSGVSPVHDAVQSGAAWSYSMGNGLSSPAIAADGTIYLSGTNNLTALNKDGTFKWSRSINSGTRSSPAIGADGTIFIGGNAVVYATNPNGSSKWTYNVSGDISASPAIGADGTIYIGTRGGNFYALTSGSSSASQKWPSRNLGTMHMSSPAISPDGSTVYVNAGTSIYALYTSNGTTKWSYNFGTSTTGSCAVSPNGSVIYTGSGDGNLYAFPAVHTTPVAPLWSVNVGFKAAVTNASPAIGTDGTIYLGSNYGSLYAINSNGSEKWVYEAKWDIRASVAVNADGTVILASHDGFIRGLDAATGNEKWLHLLPNNIFTSPAIAPNGKIVLATMNGVVHGNIWGTPATTTPPSNLTITMPSATQASLVWQDNSPDEYGFRIERKMGSRGNWTALPNVVDPTSKLPTVGADVTTHTDSGLLSGQTYYYRVCAFQSGGNTAYTNEATAVTPGVQAPDGLVATPISFSQVDLSWTDLSPDELGFVVERAVGENGLYEEIALLGPNVTTYSDTAVYPSRFYYYRVRGYDGINLCSASNWACAYTGDTMAEMLPEMVRGNQDRKELALTFDAGTAAIQTSLLNTLRDTQCYCSFFITGYVTEVQPTLVSRIANEGHSVGNHTYDHPDLRYVFDDEINWQLNVTEDIICNVTGHHTRPYFRAPYGARDSHVLNVAAANGFQHVYWTKSTGDSGGASKQYIIDAATTNIGNGYVILCHCTSPNTADGLPTIISSLRSQGYTLVTLPELEAPLQVTSPEGYLQPGWNLISLPIEPAMEFPHVVFRGLTLNANLKRWDRKTAAEVTYSSTTPGAFGNVYADEGYWINVPAGATIKFNGAAATTDRRIKLQYATAPSGYGLIGCPFQTAQPFTNCSVYNPAAAAPKTRTVAEAISAGWIPDSFKGWDAATQAEYDVPLLTSQMEPWKGYKAGALVQGIELIVPRPL